MAVKKLHSKNLHTVKRTMYMRFEILSTYHQKFRVFSMNQIYLKLFPSNVKIKCKLKLRYVKNAAA